MAIARDSVVRAACLLLVAALVVSPATAAISCGTVTSALAPCFEYVLSGGVVPFNCCRGVKSLYMQASTTGARRNVCECLKSVTRTATPLAVNNAKSLPGKCGVKIRYQISPSIDCSKVT